MSSWRQSVGFQPGNFFGPQAGINTAGQVAGAIDSDTAQRAFISVHHILGWAIDKNGLKHTVIWQFTD